MGPPEPVHLMAAEFKSLEFSRHFHHTYVIQVVESGIDHFECDKKHYLAAAGSIVVINPKVVHTGMPHGGTLRYRSLYPTRAWLQTDRVHMPEPVIHDPALAAEIVHAHQLLEIDPKDQDQKERLRAAIHDLFERYGSDAPEAAADEQDALHAAKKYLERRLAENFVIEEMAYEVGYSVSHLIRSFHKRYGLPPHEYLLNLRVEYARRMIEQNVPIGTVAAAAGFADQSHLVRHFKRIVGVTPGRYALSA